ncbi:MAG: hypothetical protein M5U26_28840 [Planctomycetota bacterium]|nr:hypothetical protein [Planctomycetota bacterium]
MPEWRGKQAGTAYLGSDVLWRPREWLIFHMLDEQGDGFTLDLTVRDMNTYVQGPSDLLAWVVGPDSRTLARETLEDDGVVSGNERYRDGIYDPWQDFRYREWHRTFSPGGYPPGKARSPYLEHPERLPARNLKVNVPAAGKGLYRVYVMGRWDHWVSLTPSRPVMTAVHPGPGPLYVHAPVLRESYLYVPSNTQDLGISVSEEAQPYGWTLALDGPDGKELGKTVPRAFMNYLLHTPEQKDAVYRLRFEAGQPGACLHIQGLPMVLAPDAETAKKIHGGIEVDAKNRASSFAHQRALHAWADALKPEDLAVEAKPAGERPKDLDRALAALLDAAPALLAAQDLDPRSPGFGELTEDGKKSWQEAVKAQRFLQQKHAADALAALAAWNAPANPYAGQLALVRRALLLRIGNLDRQHVFTWFDNRELPRTFTKEVKTIWDVPLRSGWYGLGLDADHIQTALNAKDLLEPALGKEAAEAWKTAFDLWIGGHWMMHVAEVSNQWTYSLNRVMWAAELTGREEYLELVRRHCHWLTEPGRYGRLHPDPTPSDLQSGLGYTRACDIGRTASGYLADGFGFDSEYTIEQVANMGRVWRELKEPCLVDWWNEFYVLKTHLTLPKQGAHTVDTYGGTCSPTDLNFRTRYYTHKSGLPEELRDEVAYGDLWKPVKDHAPRKPWPCLEDGAFVRNIDHRFFFVKTPGYYSIVYAGPTLPDWTHFGVTEPVAPGSIRCAGYSGPGYGGFQRKATKPGGLSAVWVKDCGPTFLSQNHNVMFSNVVWGRRTTPICPVWKEGDVDPTIVCSGFSDPEAFFDEAGRVYRKIERMHDTPLTVTRTIRFKDDRIVVDLEVLATQDTELKELFECLPYFADKRKVALFGADLSAGSEFVIPEFVSDAYKPAPGATADLRTGEDPSLPTATFRAVDISAESGAGTTLLLGQAHTCRQTRPLRYREVASATGAFNLPLPLKWTAGQAWKLRYALYSHAQAVSGEELKRVVAEEGL